MTENVNFISAKDLPISNADTVDVLCVDNGELKLKAGASLGGSGFVLKCEVEDIVSVNQETMTFTSGNNYDEFLKVLEKGGSAYIAMTMAAMQPSLATAIPYVYINVLSWMFIPAGVTGNETNMVSCYGTIGMMGTAMQGTFNLVNGSYVPTYGA